MTRQGGSVFVEEHLNLTGCTPVSQLVHQGCDRVEFGFGDDSNAADVSIHRMIRERRERAISIQTGAGSDPAIELAGHAAQEPSCQTHLVIPVNAGKRRRGLLDSGFGRNDGVWVLLNTKSITLTNLAAY